MRTTIILPPPLRKAVMKLSKRRNVSMTKVIEDALRVYLSQSTDKSLRSFVLQDCSVAGEGLAPEYQDGDWSKVRAAIYEGQIEDE